MAKSRSSPLMVLRRSARHLSLAAAQRQGALAAHTPQTQHAARTFASDEGNKLRNALLQCVFGIFGDLCLSWLQGGAQRRLGRCNAGNRFPQAAFRTRARFTTLEMLATAERGERGVLQYMQFLHSGPCDPGACLARTWQKPVSVLVAVPCWGV